MTFYLKYRPQKLSDLDSKQASNSLQKIVESGNIPHAFLFSGPKGTGKTSAARILAKIVNCEAKKKGSIEPCNECSQCLSISKGENMDVLEIDAASHRGIDDVRALRDAIKLSPARAKKKVYIIDEAHMLTTEASNALLKTLEEPPDHAMFILATTNPEKLLDTIRSRTTTIQFAKGTRDEIVSSLQKVAKGENMKVDDSVLSVIADVSKGSFRDATKIFEQVIFEGIKLDKEGLEEYLLDKKGFDVDLFLSHLSEHKVRLALSDVESVIENGGSIERVLMKVLDRLRLGLLFKAGADGIDIKNLSKEELIQLIKLLDDVYLKISKSILEQIPLEVAIVEWCSSEDKGSDGNEEKNIRQVKSTNGESERKEDKASTDKSEDGTEKKETFSKTNGVLADGLWEAILTKVREVNTSTEALLRAAKPMDFDGKTLNLAVFYKFHKERLEVHPHREVLEEVVGIVIGDRIRVVCVLTEPPSKPKVNQETPVVLTESKDEDIIKVAKEIFEG